jgi:hypothetical protein
MVVDPGAEEADEVVQVAVAGGKAAQLGCDLLLGVRAGQVQLGGGAQPRRDRREQLLDVAQAETGQHPLDVGVGMGLVGHRLPLRAAGSMGHGTGRPGARPVRKGSVVPIPARVTRGPVRVRIAR